MKVYQATIYQKQRPAVEKVWRVLDKALNPGFNGLIIAECPNKETAEKIANQQKTIAAQAAEIQRLEEIIDHVYTYWYEPKDSRMDGIEIRKVLQAEVEKRRKVKS